VRGWVAMRTVFFNIFFGEIRFRLHIPIVAKIRANRADRAF
jgi:hypothetical protein